MKKIIALVLTMFIVLCMSSCTKTEQNDVRTFRYAGKHECYTISDVSFSFSYEGSELDYGTLKITKEFDFIASYTLSFYTLRSNGERNVFYTQQSTDLAKENLSRAKPLGKSSSTGSNIIINLEQGLWVELKVMDAEGDETSWGMKLDLVE